jgi:hypothetical protein
MQRKAEYNACRGSNMSVESLQELFLDEVKDLYSAEKHKVE